MFDKLKGIGDQVGAMTTEAVDSATATVKSGVDKLTSASGAAASVATDKAVRTAIDQLRRVVRISSDELLRRPPSERPSTLTATVNIGITSLELTVEIPGGTAPAEAEAPAQVADLRSTASE